MVNVAHRRGGRGHAGRPEHAQPAALLSAERRSPAPVEIVSIR